MYRIGGVSTDGLRVTAEWERRIVLDQLDTFPKTLFFSFLLTEILSLKNIKLM